jgi:hypothetical protein
MVHYRKLKEKQSLRRRKGFQGQFTPSSKDRSAEDNTGKYKPVMCFTVETEATGAIGVQILSKSMTFMSPFNTGINLDQSQINTTKRKINLSITNVFKLSGHFNENNISQNKKDKVVQFVNNTIEVHKSVITPVGSLKNRLNEWRLITHNQCILYIVENGYNMPFKSEPE